MKISVVIVFVVLLFSCQKKAHAPAVVSTLIQDNIIKLYNDKTDKDNVITDSILNYTLQLEKASQNQSNEYKAMVAIVLGLQASNKTSYLLGIKHYEKALSLLYFSSADSLKAEVYKGMGTNYKNIGNYSKAFKNLYKSLTLYEKINNPIGKSSVNTLIGDAFFQMDQTEKAKTYILAAVKILENQKSNPTYLKAAHSLANYYGMKGDFESALKIDEMGIRISDQISAPKMKVAFMDNKANCYMFSNRMDSAYYYFNECLKLDLKLGNKKQIADTYSNLGQFFMMKKNFPEAEKQIKLSISLLKSLDAKPNLGKSYAILSEIYTNQNLYEKAFTVQKEQLENNRLMLEEKEAAALSEYKIIYETQKKESQINILQQQGKIRNLIIKQQQLKIERKNYLMIVFGLLIIILLVMFYFWKSRQKLRAQLDHEKTIKDTEETERNRMAKDIHDDLGSGLSKINFLSEIIFQKTAEIPEVQTSSRAVQETAKKMIENMRDLIWALNSENTTIANLIARMREYTTDYFEDSAIQIRYNIPNEMPQSEITKEAHRQLFMVVKEILNNIFKHACATQITFNVQITSEFLILTITDNGLGYDDQNTKGNGIRNMKSRVAIFEGKFEIVTSKLNGTTILVTIPLPKILKY